MKLPRHLGALINTRASLGAKPAKKAPKNRVAEDIDPNRGSRKRAERQRAATAELAKVWR